MAKSRGAITDAELAVLKLLWDGEAQTARAITEALYPACTESDVGTVHSLLQRLERKRMVRRDRRPHAHLFSAAVTQSDVAGQELEAMAQKLANGSMAPFITHIVQQQRLSKDELAELRKLLEQHRR